MSRCEFKTYHTRYHNKSRGYVTEKVSQPFEGLCIKDGNEDNDYALLIRRKFNEKYELDSTTLTVNSPHLLHAFRELVGTSYTTLASDFKKPFELQSPFQVLAHYWDELEQYGKDTEDDQARLHVNLLLEFMQNELGVDRAKAIESMNVGLISYPQAWLLYRPGDLLYSNVMGYSWLLRCQKTAYEESTKAGPYCIVYCTYTDHDGTLEGTAEHKFMMYQKRSFASGNPALITSLPVYPRRYVMDDGLEAKLAVRGRKFLAHKSACIQSYDGIARYLKEPPYSWYSDEADEYNGVWLPYTETGRVILDRKTFEEDQWSNSVRIKANEPEHMLCPPYAMGYSLSRKDWCQFFVDNTSEVQWKQDVWERLILSDQQKEVLEALVSSHNFPENARDQPEQKGKGLVILLHGTPGSGKTLTAETAAEGSRKALMPASLGELNRGDNPWAFEYNLKQVLQYATTWKAIVLLDEADVFLESRQDFHGDAARNALVAVFLKELEYFSGIVFLTTNRLASFDLAMKSRIHLALGFDPPDVEMRRQIWMQVLNRIPEDEIDMEDIDESVENLLLENINGREISNATNTARTIARFQKRKLQLGDIEKVLGVRREFDKSLQREARRLTARVTGLSGVEDGLLRHNSIVTDSQL